MKRRDFLQYTSLGLGAALASNIPVFGNIISPDQFLEPVDDFLRHKLHQIRQVLSIDYRFINTFVCY